MNDSKPIEAEFGAHMVIGLYYSGNLENIPKVKCQCGYYKDVVINNGYKWICNWGCENEHITE